MIYRGDNKLIWDILNIPLDINNLDVNSLLNLPTHINLIDECCNDDYYNNIDDPYDIINDFEPLHGWDNLLERSSDTEKELDNDLENNIKIENNFVYPDMDDEDYDKSEVEDSIHTDINEEYRIDPYDGNLYTKSEFIRYYRGEIEWEFANPRSSLLRGEYYKFAQTFSHLSDKKFIFLFNEFQKTY